jgi:hypothetical protein
MSCVNEEVTAHGYFDNNPSSVCEEREEEEGEEEGGSCDLGAWTLKG